MELKIRSKSSTTQFPVTSNGSWKIGRHPDSDITIDDPKASRRHGLLTSEKNRFYYEDLGTGNGSKISGASVPPNNKVEIKIGDTIEIGEHQLQITNTEVQAQPESSLTDGNTGQVSFPDPNGKTKTVQLGNEPNLIGRLPICQIRIDDPGSSRINTEIILEGDQYQIRDLGSSNGTYVNEERISKTSLTPGDIIRVGNHQIEFSHAEIKPVSPTDPINGSKTLKSGCNLLSFGLITAIISGVAVYLYMAKFGSATEDSTTNTPASELPAATSVNIPVTVGNPLIMDMPVTLEKTGNVQLARQDIIPFPIGQKVTTVHVENRQRVIKGDPLVTFEMTDELRSARKQANAGLNQAREDVAKAESEVAKAEAVAENSRETLSIIQSTHDRSRRVYQNGNLLQKEWDEILLKLAEAKAAVKLRAEEKEQAKRTVTQALEKVVQVQTDLNDVDLMINDLTVTANSAGVVNRLELKEGYTVTAINASMELIEYETEVKIVVSVSEDDINDIRDGQPADIWLSRTPGKVFRGQVSYIPPTAVSRNYAVEIEAPNRDFHFRPGQQVSVRFITATRNGATLLPISSLDANTQTGYHIFKVDPTSAIARKVPVLRGQEMTHEGEKYVEVTPIDNQTQLSKDDLIILRGNKAVKDNTKVIIQAKRLR